MNGRNKKTSAKTHTRNTKPNRKTTVRTQWTGSIKRANGSLFQLYICVAVRIILSNLTPYNSYWVRSLFDDRLKVKSYIFVKCVCMRSEKLKQANDVDVCGCAEVRRVAELRKRFFQSLSHPTASPLAISIVPILSHSIKSAHRHERKKEI